MIKINSIKDKTYDVFSTDANSKKEFKLINVIDDYFISGLIIVNIIAIILESFDSLYTEYHTLFTVFDWFAAIVFTIEYLVRIWIADRLYFDMYKKRYGDKFEGLYAGKSPWYWRRKYILSPMGLTDFVAIAPFYLPLFVALDPHSLKIVQLIRLVRLFKLAHYFSSLTMVLNVIRGKKDELLTTIFASTVMILLSASIMYHIEHDIQPDKFPNIFASFWWAVATLTTIGYGDVFPVTGMGQFLAAITALFGIGLVAIPTGIVSMGFMEEIQKKKTEKEKEEQKDDPYNYCPHCGKKLRE